MGLLKKKQPKFAEVKKPEAPEQSKEEMEQELEELEAEEQESPKPEEKIKKVSTEKEEPKEKNVAMIVSSRFTENGNIETVVVSNKAIGEVGESWNLDDEE